MKPFTTIQKALAVFFTPSSDTSTTEFSKTQTTTRVALLNSKIVKTIARCASLTHTTTNNTTTSNTLTNNTPTNTQANNNNDDNNEADVINSVIEMCDHALVVLGSLSYAESAALIQARASLIKGRETSAVSHTHENSTLATLAATDVNIELICLVESLDDTNTNTNTKSNDTTSGDDTSNQEKAGDVKKITHIIDMLVDVNALSKLKLGRVLQMQLLCRVSLSCVESKAWIEAARAATRIVHLHRGLTGRGRASMVQGDTTSSLCCCVAHHVLATSLRHQNPGVKEGDTAVVKQCTHHYESAAVLAKQLGAASILTTVAFELWNYLLATSTKNNIDKSFFAPIQTSLKCFHELVPGSLVPGLSMAANSTTSLRVNLCIAAIRILGVQNRWKEALEVCDSVYRALPKQAVAPLWLYRVVCKTKLQHNIDRELIRLENVSPLNASEAWLALAHVTTNPTQQLEMRRKAIDVFTSSSSSSSSSQSTSSSSSLSSLSTTRVDHAISLIRFAEWASRYHDINPISTIDIATTLLKAVELLTIELTHVVNNNNNNNNNNNTTNNNNAREKSDVDDNNDTQDSASIKVQNGEEQKETENEGEKETKVKSAKTPSKKKGKSNKTNDNKNDNDDGNETNAEVEAYNAERKTILDAERERARRGRVVEPLAIAHMMLTEVLVKKDDVVEHAKAAHSAIVMLWCLSFDAANALTTLRMREAEMNAELGLSSKTKGKGKPKDQAKSKKNSPAKCKKGADSNVETLQAPSTLEQWMQFNYFKLVEVLNGDGDADATHSPFFSLQSLRFGETVAHYALTLAQTLHYIAQTEMCLPILVLTHAIYNNTGVAVSASAHQVVSMVVAQWYRDVGVVCPSHMRTSVSFVNTELGRLHELNLAEANNRNNNTTTNREGTHQVSSSSTSPPPSSSSSSPPPRSSSSTLESSNNHDGSGYLHAWQWWALGATTAFDTGDLTTSQRLLIEAKVMATVHNDSATLGWVALCEAHLECIMDRPDRALLILNDSLAHTATPKFWAQLLLTYTTAISLASHNLPPNTTNTDTNTSSGPSKVESAITALEHGIVLLSANANDHKEEKELDSEPMTPDTTDDSTDVDTSFEATVDTKFEANIDTDGEANVDTDGEGIATRDTTKTVYHLSERERLHALAAVKLQLAKILHTTTTTASTKCTREELQPIVHLFKQSAAIFLELGASIHYAQTVLACAKIFFNGEETPNTSLSRWKTVLIIDMLRECDIILTPIVCSLTNDDDDDDDDDDNDDGDVDEREAGDARTLRTASIHAAGNEQHKQQHTQRIFTHPLQGLLADVQLQLSVIELGLYVTKQATDVEKLTRANPAPTIEEIVQNFVKPIEADRDPIEVKWENYSVVSGENIITRLGALRQRGWLRDSQQAHAAYVLGLAMRLSSETHRAQALGYDLRSVWSTPRQEIVADVDVDVADVAVAVAVDTNQQSVAPDVSNTDGHENDNDSAHEEGGDDDDGDDDDDNTVGVEPHTSSTDVTTTTTATPTTTTTATTTTALTSDQTLSDNLLHRSLQILRECVSTDLVRTQTNVKHAALAMAEAVGAPDAKLSQVSAGYIALYQSCVAAEYLLKTWCSSLPQGSVSQEKAIFNQVALSSARLSHSGGDAEIESNMAMLSFARRFTRLSPDALERSVLIPQSVRCLSLQHSVNGASLFGAVVRSHYQPDTIASCKISVDPTTIPQLLQLARELREEVKSETNNTNVPVTVTGTNESVTGGEQEPPLTVHDDTIVNNTDTTKATSNNNNNNTNTTTTTTTNTDDNNTADGNDVKGENVEQVIDPALGNRSTRLIDRITSLLDAYLKPVFDVLMPALFDSGANEQVHVVILADAPLLTLPLETLTIFQRQQQQHQQQQQQQQPILSISRDFSVQAFTNRIHHVTTEEELVAIKKMSGKPAKPLKGDLNLIGASRAAMLYVIDPLSDLPAKDSLEITTGCQRMHKECEPKSEWIGVVPNDGAPSVPAIIRHLSSAPCFIHCGGNNLATVVGDVNMGSLMLDDCRLAIALDNVSPTTTRAHVLPCTHTDSATNEQTDPCDGDDDADDMIAPSVRLAAMLSVRGVTSIGVNQWNTTVAHATTWITKAIPRLASTGIAQTIQALRTPKPKPENNVDTDVEKKPDKKSAKKDKKKDKSKKGLSSEDEGCFEVEELAARYNTVVFGLPHVSAQ